MIATLVLLFGAAVAIIAMLDVSGLTPCGDVGNDVSKLSSDGTCFDGSGTRKAITLVLGWPGAALAALSVLLMAGVAIRGRGTSLAIVAVVAGAVLFGLAILVGSV